MPALRSFVLLLAVTLTGCSMFHGGDANPPSTTDNPPAKKSFSWWPLGKHGPQDATEYLEYQRVHSEKDKSLTALLIRNTHGTKPIEGDIRTTIETSANESKVDNMHFHLGPEETKKVLVYPSATRLTYEVTAFFKE